MLKIRFLIISFSIICLFVMHACCSDLNDMMTPEKAHNSRSTVVEFTPGQVLSQRQAEILIQRNFESLLGSTIVDSWGIDWSVFADSTLAHDHPQKLANVSSLMKKLNKFSTKRTDAAFFDLYGKIAAIKNQMEAVHGERLEDKTFAYFSALFPDSNIRTDTKDEGVQLGTKAFITLPTGEVRKYHVKTHSEGRLSSKSSAAKLVAPEELIIYKILQYTGVGCESHFFQRSPVDVYIATLDASHTGSFKLFKDIITKEEAFGETVWGKLGIIKNSPRENDFNELELVFNDPLSQNFIQQMATLDILTRILRLQDLLNNPENFGFVAQSGQRPTLKVIDFRVLDEREFRITKDHFRGFLVGNGLYNYAASHKTMRFALHDRSRDKRIETALHVLSQNPLLSLVEHIDHAYVDVAQYIMEQPDVFSEQQAILMDKLNSYREAIIANVLFFNECLHDITILEEVTA